MNDALRNLNTTAQEAMDGSPAVARDAAGFIHIKFQCGPIPQAGVNGTSIENVVELLAKRLEGFQAGPFACAENGRALQCLRHAQEALEARTLRRVAAGMEGTNVEAPALPPGFTGNLRWCGVCECSWSNEDGLPKDCPECGREGVVAG